MRAADDAALNERVMLPVRDDGTGPASYAPSESDIVRMLTSAVGRLNPVRAARTESRLNFHESATVAPSERTGKKVSETVKDASAESRYRWSRIVSIPYPYRFMPKGVTSDAAVRHGDASPTSFARMPCHE